MNLPQWQTLVSQLRPYLAYVAWLQALIATSGSLYFSEVMHYPPCVLCWYQRILMYPLVIIMAVGIVLRDRKIRYYVLPLALIGFSIALYQNLLTYGVIEEGFSPCTLGVSCTTRWINWLGFITIPLLSMTAFTMITICMFFYYPTNDERQNESIE